MQAENIAEIASTEKAVHLKRVVIMDNTATGQADKKKRSQLK